MYHLVYSHSHLWLLLFILSYYEYFQKISRDLQIDVDVGELTWHQNSTWHISGMNARCALLIVQRSWEMNHSRLLESVSVQSASFVFGFLLVGVHGRGLGMAALMAMAVHISPHYLHSSTHLHTAHVHSIVICVLRWREVNLWKCKHQAPECWAVSPAPMAR